MRVEREIRETRWTQRESETETRETERGRERESQEDRHIKF